MSSGGSRQAKTAKKFTEAINLAESATTIARRADPRVRAPLSMRIAIAAAQASDEHTFTRARRDAWNHLGRARPAPEPAWYRFLDEQELSGLEALAMLHLGEPRRPRTSSPASSPGTSALRTQPRLLLGGPGRDAGRRRTPG